MGPNDSAVALGSVLVSVMDPTPGEEIAFHRWYERDHFYAGVMVGPWFFAGRRFVATRALKELRFPSPSSVFGESARGSYLALYWILAGHHDDAEAWAVERVNGLIADDRMLPSRVPVHAGFYRFRWKRSRDPDGVPVELALDHPFAGVVLMMIERRESVEAVTLEQWLRGDRLSRVQHGSPVALCLGLDPIPLPDDAPAYVERPVALERRSLHVFFLDEDPVRGWEAFFGGLNRSLAASGLGGVIWAAPFIPTIPGTDRYADELW